MNWYKTAAVNPGKYILGINGEIFPCNRDFRDCLPYVANHYNILVANQDVNSNEYAEEVIRNGLGLLTVSTGSVDVKNLVPLNNQQKGTIEKIKRQMM